MCFINYSIKRIVNLCPNMINFDAWEYSEYCTEEVIIFYAQWLCVFFFIFFLYHACPIAKEVCRGVYLHKPSACTWCIQYAGPTSLVHVLHTCSQFDTIIDEYWFCLPVLPHQPSAVCYNGQINAASHFKALLHWIAYYYVANVYMPSLYSKITTTKHIHWIHIKIIHW